MYGLQEAAASKNGAAPAAERPAPGKDDGSSPYVQAGFSSFQRTLQIYAFALTFAFRYWRLSKPGTYKKMEGGMSEANISVKKAELARWLREGLIRLGPTFIKIGQQFSTRVDVLSKEFIAELELLQDRVRALFVSKQQGDPSSMGSYRGSACLLMHPVAVPMARGVCCSTCMWSQIAPFPWVRVEDCGVTE